MSNFVYAGSKKPVQKTETELKCEKDKKSCNKKNKEYTTKINKLKNEKASLNATNNRMKIDVNKLTAEINTLKSKNKSLNESIANLENKNEIETKSKKYSFDNFLYCKCRDFDFKGKKANCNLSENWLCNSTKKMDGTTFNVTKGKALLSCINENIENFISLQGKWLKSHIKSTYNADVNMWEECQQNNSFENVINSEGNNESCEFLRIKLREFLLSDHYNAFYGSSMCVKGIFQDELM